MKTLTFEEIRLVTCGALSVTQDADGIHFYKCTQKQNEAWARARADLGERALATTGVRLTFDTDAQTLRFSVVSGDKYELWINGVFVKQFLFDAANLPQTATYPLGKGTKRVMLALPSHTKGVLSSVELDEEAFLYPVNDWKTKILFIGDSITQGWDTGYDTLSYAYRTAMFFDADFVIQGIGGAFYMENSYDKIDYDADTVIVAYGTNDWSRYATQADLQREADGFLSKLAAQFAGKRLIALTPVWRADWEKDRPMGSFSQLSAVVEKAAKRNGFTVINGFDLVAHDPAFFSDGYLHPNAVGFGIYAENLIKRLQSILKS